MKFPLFSLNEQQQLENELKISIGEEFAVIKTLETRMEKLGFVKEQFFVLEYFRRNRIFKYLRGKITKRYF